MSRSSKTLKVGILWSHCQNRPNITLLRKRSSRNCWMTIPWFASVFRQLWNASRRFSSRSRCGRVWWSIRIFMRILVSWISKIIGSSWKRWTIILIAGCRWKNVSNLKTKIGFRWGRKARGTVIWWSTRWRRKLIRLDSLIVARILEGYRTKMTLI